jgi:7-cyano-7-deazaguanine synthase in queuosine biosynthesis
VNENRLQCRAKYFLDQVPRDVDVCEEGFPKLKVLNAFGSKGMSRAAMDIIDVAVAVYAIERNLPGRQRTNPVSRIELSMELREPDLWNETATQTLEELLFFMGDTRWSFDFSHSDTPNDHIVLAAEEDSSIRAVVLFSGGLDSLCGAASIRDSTNAKLVSYYTKQKTLQQRLAEKLEMSTPVQWGWDSRPPSGRGRSFKYRGFFFLCLAAVTALSYGANRIVQFENGILASGIAPSPSDITTKHAHFRLHRLCEILFSEVLGGEWSIENPFRLKTKREEYLDLVSELGQSKARSLANMTETCWNLYAGFKLKKGDREIRKENGVPCGFCVPCIIRQTALPQEVWRDLRVDETRNHPLHGYFFREYYSMLRRIQEVRNGSIGEFCLAMDTFLQDAIKPRGGYSLDELRELFLRFSDEFMSTYLECDEQGEK